MNVEALNQLDEAQAADWFQQTCAAKTWIHQMVENRPYESLAQVKETAQHVWSKCDSDDFLEAFTAHPMIGDVDSLRKKFANTKAIAAGEQSGTAVASEATLLSLKENNQAYLEKHGFIFIICATGLSADAMLKALEARLPNDTAQEIATAAQEQIKITLLRLDKALNDGEH